MSAQVYTLLIKKLTTLLWIQLRAGFEVELQHRTEAAITCWLIRPVAHLRDGERLTLRQGKPQYSDRTP